MHRHQLQPSAPPMGSSTGTLGGSFDAGAFRAVDPDAQRSQSHYGQYLEDFQHRDDVKNGFDALRQLEVPAAGSDHDLRRSASGHAGRQAAPSAPSLIDHLEVELESKTKQVQEDKLKIQRLEQAVRGLQAQNEQLQRGGGGAGALAQQVAAIQAERDQLQRDKEDMEARWVVWLHGSCGMYLVARKQAGCRQCAVAQARVQAFMHRLMQSRTGSWQPGACLMPASLAGPQALISVAHVCWIKILLVRASGAACWCKRRIWC
jgi:hypothetical protein